MAEARRLATAGMSPFEHAWSVFTTASFENGLLPHLRLELVREDPAVSFQESRARAKRHEANNLRGVKPTPDPIPNPTPAVAQTSALSTPQYDQKMAAMETTIASLSSSMDNLKRVLVVLIGNARRPLLVNNERRRTTTATATTATPTTTRLLL